MSRPTELHTEELETVTPADNKTDSAEHLVKQLWSEASEAPKIKLDIPENTAYDFAPAQVSVIPEK